MTARALTPEEAAAMNNDSVVFGVDAAGAYLGMVARGVPFAEVGGPPPFEGVVWRWSFELEQWNEIKTLAATKELAHKTIDGAAGAARLRFITSVPGQEGTYMVKVEQAKAYLAAPTGPVPPYVQAEADATGMAVIDAAQLIVDTGSLWSDVVGPAIERERRRGKVNVDAVVAADATEAALISANAAVATAQLAAVAALNAIQP